MKEEQKYLFDLYNKMLQYFLSLEKDIYESFAAYEKEPSEQMKELLVNLCSNARGQITILIELLSKISKGNEFEKNQRRLDEKSDQLFYIRKKVLETRQK